MKYWYSSGSWNSAVIGSMETWRAQSCFGSKPFLLSEAVGKGFRYPSQKIPNLSHFWQVGFPSSHLTLRILFPCQSVALKRRSPAAGYSAAGDVRKSEGNLTCKSYTLSSPWASLPVPCLLSQGISSPVSASVIQETGMTQKVLLIKPRCCYPLLPHFPATALRCCYCCSSCDPSHWGNVSIRMNSCGHKKYATCSSVRLSDPRRNDGRGQNQH